MKGFKEGVRGFKLYCKKVVLIVVWKERRGEVGGYFSSLDDLDLVSVLDRMG